MSAARKTAARKAAPAKKAAQKRPARATAPAPSPTVPAPAGDDPNLTPADRAEQRVDLGDTAAAEQRAGRRSGPERCAMGFPIWDGATGLCRRCIIAKRDVCAGSPEA